MRYDVAIVGGGFSGSLVAAHLARHGGPDLSVCMFEPSELGRGAAYGTRHRDHLLNTRASAMSAFPDEPDHFVRWIGARAKPDDFVSRTLYGDYVAEIAHRAFEHPYFAIVPERVVAAELAGSGGFLVTTASGQWFSAETLVLATGNPAPNDDFLPRGLLDHPGYVADPWRTDYRRVAGDVLLIGSGLTALDVLVALEASGHRGSVHVVSRHGRFPEVHADGLAPCDAVPVLDATDARSLVRSFRRQVRDAAERGVDWRVVVDAIRPEGETLWKRLSAAERRRFDRHLRTKWERHRHRAPQQADAARRRYRQSGRLFVRAGRIIGFAGGSVKVEPAAGAPLRLRPDWIVNCTGPGRSRRLLADPLLAGLLQNGIASPEQLGYGIGVDGDLGVVGADGRSVRGLWVSGPLARGARFEATAVPELRVMAQLVAAKALAALDDIPEASASGTVAHA
ncbi:MAG: FAD/NAD(P)-binding protein [Candidatus Tumulicola sp.]